MSRHEHSHSHNHGDEHSHNHNHRGEHGHSHNHGDENSHNHNHRDERSRNQSKSQGGEDNNRSGKTRIRLKTKDSPGVIYIERNIHDEAIVISGSLTIITSDTEINSTIANEFEAAASQVNDNGGIVGHIKASSVVTLTSMISVTDEKAMVKDSPECMVKITLAAILFLIKPETASEIMRQALARVKVSSKQNS